MTFVRNLWVYKRKTFIAAIALVMVLVLAVVFVSRFREDKLDKDADSSGAEDLSEMYNVSRFFFRIYYPKGWEADSGAYQFMKDPDTGLVFVLYPLMEDPAAATPAGSSPSPGTPAADRTPGGASDAVGSEEEQNMIRDPSFTISIFYKNYPPELDPLSTAPPAAGAQTQQPGSTSGHEAEAGTNGSAGQSLQPAQPGTSARLPEDNSLLDRVAEMVLQQWTAEKSEAGNKTYTFGKLDYYETENIRFKTFSYSYTDSPQENGGDGTQESPADTAGGENSSQNRARTGKVYIAVRSMAYYIVVCEGAGDASDAVQGRYWRTFAHVLDSMVFTVFDH